MASFSGIKNTLLAEQADEEAAPAHDPNLKSSRPRSDMLRGLLSFFMEKKSCFPGRCGAYFLSTASAVTTMKRTVFCSPPGKVIVPSAVPM